MTRKPTASQLALIAHFAGQPSDARVSQTTYRICRERGWLRETSRWPYHEVTDLGRQVLAENGH